jgi:hypothetical protein
VRSDVEEDTFYDRGIQLEDWLLLVVLFRREAAESLIRPQTLNLGVVTSRIAFDLKVDKSTDA